jgi:hypothetical protein
MPNYAQVSSSIIIKLKSASQGEDWLPLLPLKPIVLPSAKEYNENRLWAPVSRVEPLGAKGREGDKRMTGEGSRFVIFNQPKSVRAAHASNINTSEKEIK